MHKTKYQSLYQYRRGHSYHNITRARVKYCLFSEYLNLSMLFEPFPTGHVKFLFFFFIFQLVAETKGARKCLVTLIPSQSQGHLFFSMHVFVDCFSFIISFL